MEKMEKTYNKGEHAEVITKKQLFAQKTDLVFLTALFGNDACEGIEIINPATMEPFLAAEHIIKAKSSSKADLILWFKRPNVFRYVSIKSLNGAKPALLNHTPRRAKVFQTELLLELPNLDKIAAEYIQKRTQKIIGEDIAFAKLEISQDQAARDSFARMLSYFVFTGTGAKRSPNECDSLLIVQKDNSLLFLDCSTSEKKETYIKSILDQCVVSFRNKGMANKLNDLCNPWVYKEAANKKPCGSLHVRL